MVDNLASVVGTTPLIVSIPVLLVGVAGCVFSGRVVATGRGPSNWRLLIRSTNRIRLYGLAVLLVSPP
jgi:hypothetical protein